MASPVHRTPKTKKKRPSRHRKAKKVHPHPAKRSRR